MGAEEITIEGLVEAWETNQRIHELILESLTPEALACTLSTRGGRDIARQFAHLHTQRLRWLRAKGGAELTVGLPEFESRESPSRDALLAALRASMGALTTFFRDVATTRRPLKGQKKGLVISLAYFVSHESHHRGNILLTLKQRGVKLDKAVTYGIWDWHRR